MTDKKFSLLIISPDEAFREQTKEAVSRLDTLELRGECTVYYSALDRQLFTQIEDLKVDLTLVDIGPLPEDVENALATIQKISEFAAPPVVVAAYSSQDTNVMMRLMGAGVLEYIPKPVRLENLLALTIRIAKQHEAAQVAAKRDCKVYTVFGSKGGAGTTSIATNFALNLIHMTRKPTVLVDLDMYLGEVAVFLGLNTRYSIINAIENIHRLDATMIKGLVSRHKTGLEVLATSEQPEQVHSVLPAHIREILGRLADTYDYIVIDTSNAFDPFAVTAFDCSDQIFIVSLGDLPSLRNTLRCLQTLERLGYPRERIKIVVNRFDKRQDITLTDMEKALGHPIFWTFPNDYAAVITSINTGTPLFESSNSAVTRAIRDFTQKVADVNTESKNGHKERSWLSTLLRR